MSDAEMQIERLLEVGRLREASALLAREVAERPDDPDLGVLAGRIALDEGDRAEARRQLEQSLARSPSHREARLWLFVIEEADGHYGEAERLITGLIREDPEQAPLIALYARLMMRVFQLEKARKLTDEALRLDPTDETARLTDVLLSTIEGDPARARAHLSDLIEDDPDGEAVTRALMVSLVERRRYAEALALAQQLLRIFPADENLLELIVELRVATHWLAWPLWPMQRFGWGGSVAVWIGAVVVIRVLGRTPGPVAGAFAGGYLLWVIYTWSYRPLMTRWIRARGV